MAENLRRIGNIDKIRLAPPTPLTRGCDEGPLGDLGSPRRGGPWPSGRGTRTQADALVCSCLRDQREPRLGGIVPAPRPRPRQMGSCSSRGPSTAPPGATEHSRLTAY